MLRDHRHPDPLPFDPLSARSLAVACALVGLVTLLLSERPTPGGVLLAWAGLVGWALLRIVGRRAAQPVRRKVRPPPEPIIEVVEVKEWTPRRQAPVLALPKPFTVAPQEEGPDWKTSAHPVVLAGVRRRREEG
ncbi:hypothetical protein [Methylobacterium frigidaeris]|uniref:Uncharacterized protein n=1 Tax=Methylobacterium frigidaeris TaxID=2038277 RepID=A0AA37HFA8_9HYPH|nr:hypothetical protein [Methylobacterium frigidaeris]PIK70090.1 hypothetical protein CS379_26510 [Methylobacterium frigidaeris]GJD64966.1 hypothetical protein MPEAHAMD_5152 [Methylobacterium frigidaeris]